MKVYLVKLENCANGITYRVFLKNCKFNKTPLMKLNEGDYLVYKDNAYRFVSAECIANYKKFKLGICIPTDTIQTRLNDIQSPDRESIDQLLKDSGVTLAKPLLNKLILRYLDNSTEIVTTPNYNIEEVISYGT